MSQFDDFIDENLINETKSIIDIYQTLGRLNKENFMEYRTIFINSLVVASKAQLKRFIRCFFNIIRFRTKNIALFANLMISLSELIPSIKHNLIWQLKHFDLMRGPHFKLFRILLEKELFNVEKFVKIISIYLSFFLEHSESTEPLVPMFLWFLPEIEKYNQDLFYMFMTNSNVKSYVIKHIYFLRENNYRLFFKYMDHLYFPNSIEYAIYEDDFTEFLEIMNTNDTNNCNIPIFDFNLPVEKHPTLIQFAAFYGAKKCFKFLSLNSDIEKVNNTIDYEHLYNQNLDESLDNDDKKDKNQHKYNSVSKLILPVASDEDSSDSNSEDDIYNNSNSKDDMINPNSEDAIYIDSNSDSELIVISSSDSDNTSPKDEYEYDKLIDIIEKSLWKPPKFAPLPNKEREKEETILEPSKIRSLEYQNIIKVAITSQYAVAGGNYEIIKILQQNNILFFDTEKIAVAFFHNEIATWLIENANSNLTGLMGNLTSYYSIILYSSIITGNLEIVKYILEVTQKSFDQFPIFPLHLAIKFSQYDILCFLLNFKKINVNTENNFFKTPFFVAVDNKSLKMVKMIVNHPSFSHDFAIKEAIKPVHYVALFGNEKIAHYYFSLKEVNINDNILYTPLAYSLLSDNDEAFFSLISNDQINFNIKSAQSPFEICIQKGKNSHLNLLLSKNSKVSDEKKFDLNSYNSEGYTLLHLSVKKKRNQAIDLLLSQNGVDRHLKTKVNGESIAHLAVQTNIKKIYKYFFDLGINHKTNDNKTLLHYAAISDSFNTYQILMNETDIDINEIDSFGNTALHYSIISKTHKIFESLITIDGINIGIKNNEGETPLILALHKNQKKIAQTLINLQQPSNDLVNWINEKDLKGNTALHLSIILKDEELTKLILKIKEIDPNVQNNLGFTPLHLCAIKKLFYISHLLIALPSIRVDFRDNEMKTALHYAAMNTNKINLPFFNQYAPSSGFPNAIFTIILDKFPEIGNYQDENGNTPFHIAFTDPTFNSTYLKNNLNLRLDLLNNSGESYVHLAAGSGNRKAVDYILSKFPEMINWTTNDGNTPLHYATKYGRVEIVSILVLDDSIDKWAKNRKGETAFDTANEDMQKVFLKYFQ